MTKDVKEYVQSCKTCQENKASTVTNIAPLKPLKATGVWTLITRAIQQNAIATTKKLHS